MQIRVDNYDSDLTNGREKFEKNDFAAYFVKTTRFAINFAEIAKNQIPEINLQLRVIKFLIFSFTKVQKF